MAWATGYDFSNGCRNKKLRYFPEHLDQTPVDRPYRRSLKKVSPESPIIKNLTLIFDEMSKRSPSKPLSTEFLPAMSKYLDDSPSCKHVKKQSKDAPLSNYEHHKARVMKAWYENTQDDLEHLESTAVE